MPAYLLHIRSRLKLAYIEADLDEFEQRYLPDCHYVLSRDGYCANYVVFWKGGLSGFYKELSERACRLRVEQLSLVQIGTQWFVKESGLGEPAAPDFCGEWVRQRNEESFEEEEIRVRTGLRQWLRAHNRKSSDFNQHSSAIFISFREALYEDARWLHLLRSALGGDVRVYMRDTHSLLLTYAHAGRPDQTLNSRSVRKYVEGEHVHTVLAFRLGRAEAHDQPFLHSLLQHQPQSLAAEPDKAPVGSREFTVVRRRAATPGLEEALARLKSEAKARQRT